MNRVARRFGVIATAALVASPALVLPATQASASVPAIPATAFGMHWFAGGHAYPGMPFSTARLWAGSTPTWATLQPAAPTYTAAVPATLTTPATPAKSTTGLDVKAVTRLDNLVKTYVNHHVDPMITMGMTPKWAAKTCNSKDNQGHNYGTVTCPPVDDYKDSHGHDFGDPWVNYVTFLATRYDGHHKDASGNTLPKVTYFELWNEPSFHNGWNGTIAKLASMGAHAYSILHKHSQKLVAPSIPFTVGGGYSWLNSYLHASGGKSYDILGLHLYPSDATAKANYGPEWVVNTVLKNVRKVLSNNGVAGRPMWNTETNVGRVPAGVTFTGTKAAAEVARTFILATQNKIQRTFWYAADDRTWGGVWLEKSDYKTLTPAGLAEKTVRNLLVGKAALGCTRTTVGTNKWKYTCKFGTTTGHKKLLAIWTTGGNYTLKAPKGTKSSYTVTGVHHSAYAGKKFTVSHTPIYLAGSF